MAETSRRRTSAPAHSRALDDATYRERIRARDAEVRRQYAAGIGPSSLAVRFGLNRRDVLRIVGAGGHRVEADRGIDE